MKLKKFFKKARTRLFKQIENNFKKLRKELSRLFGREQLDTIDDAYADGLEFYRCQENALIQALSEEEAAAHRELSQAQQSLQLQKHNAIQQFQTQYAASFQQQTENEKAFLSLKSEVEASMRLFRGGLYACATGNIDIVQALLEGDVTLREAFLELNPLFMAAAFQRLDIIRLLARFGANLSRRNSKMQLAVEVAERRECGEAVKLLKALAVVSATLRDAVKAHDLKRVVEALQQDADCNDVGKDGLNALQLALIHKAPMEVIRVLVKAYADVEYQGNCSKTTLQLAEAHPDGAVAALIKDALELQQGVDVSKPCVFSDTFLGQKYAPAFSDGNGWDKAEHHETIRLFSVPNKGHDDCYVLARAVSGILFYQLRDGWTTLNNGPALSNVKNWHFPSHFKTINGEILQVNGEYQLYFWGKSDVAGLHLWSYSFRQGQWEELPDGPSWHKNNGWHYASSFETIQGFKMRVKGKDLLYLLGRTDDTGIILWCFNPETKQWRQLQNGPAWKDGDWRLPKQYQTIRGVVVNVDGVDVYYLIGRSDARGIELWVFNSLNETWEQCPDGPAFNVGNGWDQEQFFSSLRLITARVKGEQKLFLSARCALGILLHVYHPKNKAWGFCGMGPSWQSTCGWYAPEYNSTQALNVIPNGDSDLILLTARCSKGMLSHVFCPEQIAWADLGLSAQFSDVNGWYMPRHYASIRVTTLMRHHKPYVVFLGRGAQTLAAYSYAINRLMVKALMQKPNLCVAPVQALLDHVDSQNRAFLELVKAGNLTGLNQLLQSFVDIGVKDTANRDALQIAIGEGVHLNVVKRLVALGFDINLSTVQLALTHNRPLMAGYFAELLSLRSSLNLPMEGNFSERFAHHLKRLQEYVKASQTPLVDLMGYYRWVALDDPYVVEALPAVTLLHALEVQRVTLQEKLQNLAGDNAERTETQSELKHLEESLKKASEFFVQALAFYHTQNDIQEVDNTHRVYPFLSTSLSLKKAALQLAETQKQDWRYPTLITALYQDSQNQELLRTGIQAFLKAFSDEVLVLPETDLETLAKTYAEQQKTAEGRCAVSEEIRSLMNTYNSSENSLTRAKQHGLTVQNSILDLQQALEVSNTFNQKTLQALTKQADELKAARELLVQTWENLRTQHNQNLSTLDTAIEATNIADREVAEASIKRLADIHRAFEIARGELKENIRQNRKHLERVISLKLGITAGTTLLSFAITGPILSALNLAKLKTIEYAAWQGVINSGLNAAFNKENLIKSVLEGAALGALTFKLNDVLKITEQFTAMNALKNTVVSGITASIGAAIHKRPLNEALIPAMGAQLLSGLLLGQAQQQNVTLSQPLARSLQTIIQSGLKSTLTKESLPQALLTSALTAAITAVAETTGTYLGKVQETKAQERKDKESHTKDTKQEGEHLSVTGTNQTRDKKPEKEHLSFTDFERKQRSDKPTGLSGLTQLRTTDRKHASESKNASEVLELKLRVEHAQPPTNANANANATANANTAFGASSTSAASSTSFASTRPTTHSSVSSNTRKPTSLELTSRPVESLALPAQSNSSLSFPSVNPELHRFFTPGYDNTTQRQFTPSHNSFSRHSSAASSQTSSLTQNRGAPNIKPYPSETKTKLDTAPLPPNFAAALEHYRTVNVPEPQSYRIMQESSLLGSIFGPVLDWFMSPVYADSVFYEKPSKVSFSFTTTRDKSFNPLVHVTDAATRLDSTRFYPKYRVTEPALPALIESFDYRGKIYGNSSTPEERRYLTRMAGEALARGAINLSNFVYDAGQPFRTMLMSGIPKKFQSVAFFHPDRPSDRIHQFLSTQGIDLNQAPPRNAVERGITFGLEFAGEAGALGLGLQGCRLSTWMGAKSFQTLSGFRLPKTTLMPEVLTYDRSTSILPSYRSLQSEGVVKLWDLNGGIANNTRKFSPSTFQGGNTLNAYNKFTHSQATLVGENLTLDIANTNISTYLDMSCRLKGGKGTYTGNTGNLGLKGSTSTASSTTHHTNSPAPKETKTNRELILQYQKEGVRTIPGSVRRMNNKQHAKFLEKDLGLTPYKEHIDLKAGAGGVHAYENFDKAREAAKMRAHLGDDAIPYLQKVGPHKNSIYTGMQSKDKTCGWRLDYDPTDRSKGVHINWWFKPDANKKVTLKGMINIENGTYDIYQDILSHFPKKGR